jgi:hypothetical protein
MKDAIVVLSIAGCLVAGLGVWRAAFDAEATEGDGLGVLSEDGAAEISAAASRWSASLAGRLARTGWGRSLARGSENEVQAEAAFGSVLFAPCARMALFVAMSPVLVPLALAALALGLHLRQQSLLGQRWRSPTLAYLAKKSFFYPGLLGVLVFCTLPMSVPLWLIYVAFIPLCGGLTLYVGSIGRI